MERIPSIRTPGREGSLDEGRKDFVEEVGATPGSDERKKRKSQPSSPTPLWIDEGGEIVEIVA